MLRINRSRGSDIECLDNALKADNSHAEAESQALNRAIDRTARSLHFCGGEDTHHGTVERRFREREVVRAVKVPKVRGVDGVLAHLFVAGAHRPLCVLPVGPFSVANAILRAHSGISSGMSHCGSQPSR